jgi:hypothetical protein
MTLWLGMQVLLASLVVTMAILTYQMRCRLPTVALATLGGAIALFGVLEIMEWTIR